MMKVESKAIEEKSAVESKSDSKLVEEKPKIDEVVGEKPTVERASAPDSAEGSSGKDNNNAFPKSKHVNRNPITGEGMPSLAPGQRRVPRKGTFGVFLEELVNFLRFRWQPSTRNRLQLEKST